MQDGNKKIFSKNLAPAKTEPCEAARSYNLPLKVLKNMVFQSPPI